MLPPNMQWAVGMMPRKTPRHADRVTILLLMTTNVVNIIVAPFATQTRTGGRTDEWSEGKTTG